MTVKAYQCPNGESSQVHIQHKNVCDQASQDIGFVLNVCIPADIMVWDLAWTNPIEQQAKT